MTQQLVKLATACAAIGALLLSMSTTSQGQDYDREPIKYSTAEPDNRVSRLFAQIESGEKKLQYDERVGYLKSLLQELEIPTDSQMLVFSKTSLQRHRISPRHPRALYFNDDTYIGYCEKGDVLEVSVADPKLGTVFYTLDQDPEEPFLSRQTDSCLICHSSSRTEGVPGHVVRSVYSDAGGYPILASGTHTIDYRSPIEHRWGGWYVTGTHGDSKHLGNMISRKGTRAEATDNVDGQNVVDLTSRFKTGSYLEPGSDIVALMVMEHQTRVHNLLTRASFQTRLALRDSRILKEALEEPLDELTASSVRRINNAAEKLVEAMLWTEEAPLTGGMKSVSGFPKTFSVLGPHDSKGRSLREFDLANRVFKYPCSYLIYSESFESLPDEARDRTYRRLFEVLSGTDRSEPFQHLSDSDRTAILEIIRETKSGLPAYWNANATAVSAATN